MPIQKRSITGTIRVIRKALINGRKALLVEVKSLNGTECRPTKLYMAPGRMRGNKMYCTNGVYEVVNA
jgi:hypothetical protein